MNSIPSLSPAPCPARTTAEDRLGQAVKLIRPGGTVATGGGFVGIGFPRTSPWPWRPSAWKTRLQASPRQTARATLTLVYAGGRGDGRATSSTTLGHDGLGVRHRQPLGPGPAPAKSSWRWPTASRPGTCPGVISTCSGTSP